MRECVTYLCFVDDRINKVSETNDTRFLGESVTTELQTCRTIVYLRCHDVTNPLRNVIITSETAFFVSHLYLAENGFVVGLSHDIKAGEGGEGCSPEKAWVQPFLGELVCHDHPAGSVIMITSVRTIGHGRWDMPYLGTSTPLPKHITSSEPRSGSRDRIRVVGSGSRCCEESCQESSPVASEGGE